MPIRQLALLLGLLGLCAAIIGLAWVSGSELFLFVPTRSGALHPPPSHPAAILALLVVSLTLTYWFREHGVYFFIIMTTGMLLGSAVGFFVYAWTPSWAQHLLAVAMIATSFHAWEQKSYFED